MAILETSFLIDILRDKQDAIGILDKLEQKEQLFIAAPSVMEMWEGALLSNLSSREKSRVDGILSAVTILPLDANGAKRAAEISFELSRKGLPIETEDMMIAGIAMARGETIVTRNPHYARVAGLKILKY